MTTYQEKIIKPRVGLLELAKELGNVSQACKIMGSYPQISQKRHLVSVTITG